MKTKKKSNSTKKKDLFDKLGIARFVADKKKITVEHPRKKKNLLIYSALVNFVTYQKKIFKHPYKKKNLPLFFFIKQVCCYFKKNLQIIFKYHINKKKILFVGGEELFKPKKKIIFYVIKKAKHSFVPRFAWMNGFISNQKFVYEHFFKKKKWLIKQINRNPELAITQNSWNVINSECYNKKIPQIILNTRLELNDYYIKKNNIAYGIPINFELTLKKKIEKYFFGLITKILKFRLLTGSRHLFIKKNLLVPKKKKNRTTVLPREDHRVRPNTDHGCLPPMVSVAPPKEQSRIVMPVRDWVVPKKNYVVPKKKKTVLQYYLEKTTEFVLTQITDVFLRWSLWLLLKKKAV